MFGLAAVLFFSVTGITLNHPDWFFGEAERTRRGRGPDRSQVAAPRRAAAARLAATSPTDVARRSRSWRSSSTCARPTAIRGALAEFRADERECMVTFKGPGYAADAFIDRDDGPLQPDADRTTASSPSSTTCTRAATPARPGRWSSTSRPSLMTVDLADRPGPALLPEAPAHSRPGRDADRHGRRRGGLPGSGCPEGRGIRYSFEDGFVTSGSEVWVKQLLDTGGHCDRLGPVPRRRSPWCLDNSRTVVARAPFPDGPSSGVADRALGPSGWPTCSGCEGRAASQRPRRRQARR